jgi:transcription-repair coupling factor (superfamily II helicase)
MDAYIPETYIPDPRQKMEWYKRLAAVETRDELKEMEEELQDRYGEAPYPLKSLLEAVEIRIWAKELGLSEVVCRHSQVVLRYFEDRMPGDSFVSEMMLRFKDKIRFLPGPPPGLSLTTPPGQAGAILRSMLPQLKHYVKIPTRS